MKIENYTTLYKGRGRDREQEERAEGKIIGPKRGKKGCGGKREMIE